MALSFSTFSARVFSHSSSDVERAAAAFVAALESETGQRLLECDGLHRRTEITADADIVVDGLIDFKSARRPLTEMSQRTAWQLPATCSSMPPTGTGGTQSVST